MYLPSPAGRVLIALVLLLLSGSLCGCRQQTAADSGGNSGAATTAAVSTGDAAANTLPVRFTDITREAGIDFVHVNGARGRKLMPETVGSGLAFFDYDNDGHLDLLVMNGRSWPGDPKPIKSTPRLYRNTGGGGRFEDVTEAMGLDVSLYGMGVAVGDFDNDGDQDVYLTAVGPNYLFRNENGKRFTNITAQAGVIGVPLPGTKMEHKWSSSAAWIDYDKDGRLDLFVCQYVKWSPDLDPFCGHNNVRGYCPPGNFEGARCTLFRNEGNGRFRDVSREIGLLDGAVGKSFGIAFADFNGDGWMDFVVANDTWANFLFLNENGKRLVEKGIESGIAFAEDGHAKAGMGIDIADYRNSGRFGVVIGNFINEGLSLFESEGDENAVFFTDQAQVRGVATPTLLNVTFATFFFDYDNDGWQDLFVTNGHVDDIVNTYASEITFKQKPLLLRNVQRGERFEPVEDSGLSGSPIVGRGAAYGDIDNDGDLDVGVVDNGGRFRLFRNDNGNRNQWIRFQAQGTQSNRDGIGTLIKVTAAAGDVRTQYVKSGSSFLSESQRAVTFGLGDRKTVEAVEVRWPSGTVDRAQTLSAGQVYRVIEGQGFAPIAP